MSAEQNYEQNEEHTTAIPEKGAVLIRESTLDALEKMDNRQAAKLSAIIVEYGLAGKTDKTRIVKGLKPAEH